MAPSSRLNPTFSCRKLCVLIRFHLYFFQARFDNPGLVLRRITLNLSRWSQAVSLCNPEIASSSQVPESLKHGATYSSRMVARQKKVRGVCHLTHPHYYPAFPHFNMESTSMTASSLCASLLDHLCYFFTLRLPVEDSFAAEGLGSIGGAPVITAQRRRPP
jgi:hypothetical protein